MIGVHASGFEPSARSRRGRAAVARLGIAYPVVVDAEFEIWQRLRQPRLAGPLPVRRASRGCSTTTTARAAYDETELAIQELLGVERPTLEPVRPEDVPGALLTPQTEDVAGPYSGPYEAGGVWAVLDGAGTVTANGRAIEVDHPGAYELIAHERSTAGTLELELGAGVRCHAVCFTPGLA